MIVGNHYIQTYHPNPDPIIVYVPCIDIVTVDHDGSVSQASIMLPSNSSNYNQGLTLYPFLLALDGISSTMKNVGLCVFVVYIRSIDFRHLLGYDFYEDMCLA